MQIIEVNKPSGFKGYGNIVILDENQKPFYNYSPKNGLFNLPKGIYYTDSNIIQLNAPIKVRLPELPNKQKRTDLEIEEFEVKITRNPHKATIYLSKGIIEIDTNFWNRLTKPQKDYVLSHELGHRYYESEKSADLYATKKMLENGYNPSQIAQVVLNTFSINKTNVARCENVINNLIK